MTAQCLDCATLYNWRAQRGTRLADLRCKCGGNLETTFARFVGKDLIHIGKKSGRTGHWPEHGWRGVA